MMLDLHDNRFFFHTDDDSDMLFDKSLMWIYHNHERMQQSDKRVWTLADQGLEQA